MATRTKTQLAQAVLEHLAVLGANQTISAEDNAYVSGRYEDLWEEMADDNNMAYWPQNEIPAVVFEPLVHLVAVSVGSAFGKPRSIRDLEQDIMICKRRIRRHTKVTGAETSATFEDF
jgi:hypothetical protein